jgi:uncharacterized small protein (DUF1192 family)
VTVGELGLDQLGAAIGTLSERLDRVEAQVKSWDGVIVGCVMALAWLVDELRGRVALLAQAEGVIADRRVS